MTRKEFEEATFRKGDKVIYHDIECDIVQIEFIEGLLGIRAVGELGEISWCRCENLEYRPHHY